MIVTHLAVDTRKEVKMKENAPRNP